MDQLHYSIGDHRKVLATHSYHLLLQKVKYLQMRSASVTRGYNRGPVRPRDHASTDSHLPRLPTVLPQYNCGCAGTIVVYKGPEGAPVGRGTVATHAHIHPPHTPRPTPGDVWLPRGYRPLEDDVIEAYACV